MNEQNDGIKREKVRVVPIQYVDDFPDHPFLVKDEREYGTARKQYSYERCSQPVIARKKDDERYELISGHRRKHACKILELDHIPIIVSEMSRDDAVLKW